MATIINLPEIQASNSSGYRSRGVVIVVVVVAGVVVVISVKGII